MIRRVPADERSFSLRPLATPPARADAEAPLVRARVLAALHTLLAEQQALAPEAIVRLVDRELARFHGARDVRVIVHPDDARLLPALDQLTARYELATPLARVLDADLARGGCVIESAEGRVDARVETRLARALALALGEDA